MATSTATAEATSLVELPPECVQLILEALHDDNAEAECLALCALMSQCKMLRAEVVAAEGQWKRLIQLCYPEDRCRPRMAVDRAKGCWDRDVKSRVDLCAKLRRWRRYAATLEAPTLEQMIACVKRSATAHSYYKHLDVSRTAPFSFKLSQVAGMRRTPDDDFVDYVRGDGTEFHYTWTETKTYREQFGMLEYDDGCSGQGARVPRPLPLFSSRKSSGSERDAPGRLGVGGYDESPVVAVMPAFAVATGATLCSTCVHSNSGTRLLFGRALALLRRSGGREASGLDGEVTQGDVCDDALQRRHANKRLRLPPGLVDKLEAIEAAVPALLPLREAMVALVAACAKSGSASSSSSSSSSGSGSSCALARKAMPSGGSSRAAAGRAFSEIVVPALRGVPQAACSLALLDLRMILWSGRDDTGDALATAAVAAAAAAAAPFRELCDVLFPSLHGAARAEADTAVARLLLLRGGGDDHHRRTHASEVLECECEYERGVAELAQCVAERYAMLEAAARATALATGRPVDLEDFHQSAEAARALFELDRMSVC